MNPTNAALGALAAAAALAAPAVAQAHDSTSYAVVEGAAGIGHTVAAERGVRVVRGLAGDALVLIDTESGRSWVLAAGPKWMPIPFARPEAAAVRVYRPGRTGE